MAPAGVERDVEGRIALPDCGDDGLGAGREAVEVHGKMVEAAAEPVIEELMRALAHRRGGEEAPARARL